MSLADRILRILRQHVGREALISSRAIARRLRLPETSEREVRRTIREMRDDGTFEAAEMFVVAIPGAGFFVVADYDEYAAYRTLLHTLKTEASRNLASFDALAAKFGFHPGKKC